MSFKKHAAQQQFVEIALIVICLALCSLLHKVGGYRMVVLNLFYLPVILAAFFLGRYRAGVLSVLCVVSAAVITALDVTNFANYTSPLVIGLALTVWAAVLGLTAILVGTLSDERTQKISELHDAYVGVVEVLSRYLNSADPCLKDRATKVSEISRLVATRMRLSEKEIDDIRVAALLQDMGNIEITARVIRRAVGDLTHVSRGKVREHTFHGSDLVQSLGSVLTGALPLLLGHDDCLDRVELDDAVGTPVEHSMGAKIIRTVRGYTMLAYENTVPMTPRDAIDLLKNDIDDAHHPAVLHALEQAVLPGPDAHRDAQRDEAEALAV